NITVEMGLYVAKLEAEGKKGRRILRQVLDAVPHHIHVKDANGRFILANKAVASSYHMNPEEFVGLYHSDVGRNQDEVKQMLAADREVMESGIPKRIPEETCIDADGKVHWLDTTKYPFDNDGEPAVLVVAVDITERKRVEEEKEKLQAQLQQARKMEAIGTLAGGIAHDFNNILTAVLGYADLALTNPNMDEHLQRYLENIFKAGKRAQDLVNQILTFSRQSDIKPGPLRLSPIIKEVLKLLRASLPSTIQIRQKIESDQDAIQADPTHIYQILMNLGTNAAYAMRGIIGELEVTLAPAEIKLFDELNAHHGLAPGMYMKLSVRDTGVGMDDATINRAFDPFFTTKKPGEGTGMGLSVVYGIVKRYSGAITVNSAIGQGTIFSVYLPRLPDKENAEELELEGLVAGGNERILYVDDEEILVDLGMEILNSLGYEVVGMTSSVEALEAFRAEPEQFDLVITDMTMPNMTGLDLAREIKLIRSDIPIVICSGFSDMLSEENIKSGNISRVIMKPMAKKEIAVLIRKVLVT
ncbi:MAG: response regulator, partial [Deltaproteobacteria bacterium]|nr:response regulator [Deltaproteobacteria bacterium]